MASIKYFLDRWVTVLCIDANKKREREKKKTPLRNAKSECEYKFLFMHLSSEIQILLISYSPTFKLGSVS